MWLLGLGRISGKNLSIRQDMPHNPATYPARKPDPAQPYSDYDNDIDIKFVSAVSGPFFLVGWSWNPRDSITLSFSRDIGCIIISITSLQMQYIWYQRYGNET